jgi:hypothetical protein
MTTNRVAAYLAPDACPSCEKARREFAFADHAWHEAEAERAEAERHRAIAQEIRQGTERLFAGAVAVFVAGVVLFIAALMTVT